MAASYKGFVRERLQSVAPQMKNDIHLTHRD